jgi:hypothetical protein
MSGASGVPPSAVALCAFTAPQVLRTNWAATTGDPIGIVSIKFNVQRLFPALGANGRQFRGIGGFAVLNNAAATCDLNLALILSSAVFGDAVVFQTTLTLPVSAARKRLYAELNVARYSNVNTGANTYVASGIYSLTGLANAEPFYYHVPFVDTNDTLRWNLIASVSTAAADLSVDSLGPTGTGADEPQGTMMFLNTPVNAPVA